MTPDEINALPGGELPVLLKDGKLGLLTVFPSAEGACGVQVHGEDSHRWIAPRDLTASERGALRERGAWKVPPRSDDLAQSIVALDWARRGGPQIPPDAPRAKPGGRMVKATAENPLPEPPGGGRWIRDQSTGDICEAE